MEKAIAKIEELSDTLRDYLDIKIESVKLSAAEKTSNMVASLATQVVLIGIFYTFILFVSIAIALGLSQWIGISWVGFLIIALIYLAIGLVIWIVRKPMIYEPRRNAFIKQLFTENDKN
jgi:high-affinity K+ transport system ATPase subunit B